MYVIIYTSIHWLPDQLLVHVSDIFTTVVHTLSCVLLHLVVICPSGVYQMNSLDSQHVVQEVMPITLPCMYNYMITLSFWYVDVCEVKVFFPNENLQILNLKVKQ